PQDRSERGIQRLSMVVVDHGRRQQCAVPNEESSLAMSGANVSPIGRNDQMISGSGQSARPKGRSSEQCKPDAKRKRDSARPQELILGHTSEAGALWSLRRGACDRPPAASRPSPSRGGQYILPLLRARPPKAAGGRSQRPHTTFI